MSRWLRALLVLGVLAGVNFSGGMSASGQDWPQWMGAKRDGVWRAEGVIESFPDDGLPVLWSSPVAGGYSGPAIAGDLVVVTDYVTKDNVKVSNFEREQFTGVERVIGLDRETGEQRWRYEYPVEYTISYPAGPRCTPVIHQGHVYTLGAEGHLLCLDAEKGAVVWERDLKSDYETNAALWGYASHPLIDGDRLICLVGGEGSHVVAFALDSGDEIWRSGTAPEQGYSPPLLIEEAGVRQLIICRPDAVVSLSPETGEEYWQEEYEATNGSIIMTPIYWNHHLFVGGYSDKNLLIELDTESPGAKTVWRDQRRAAVSPVNVQPFLDGDVVYGVDQSGELLGFELPSGKRLWSTPQPLGERRVQSGTVFLVKHGERYWMFTEQGDLIIAELSAEGFTEIDRTHVIEPTNVAFGREVVWSAPAYVGTTLFLRNDEKIICLDLSAGKE